MKPTRDWLGLRRELPEGRRNVLVVFSFALPLMLWCLVSYVPWIWHPMVRIADPGEVSYFQKEMLIEKKVFAAENRTMREAGLRQAQGSPANPIFLPAPHKVAQALITAFQTPPRLPNEPWLHESLLHSISIIFWGFALSSIIGLPLGILCGTFRAASRLTEPFIEFFRYLPAPAFGALCVAMMGIHDAPKIAIIFIGTFFQQVLVIANTVRKNDPALLEAAQTLGASRRQLIFRVIIPGSITDIYNDMRILLGWAWTYLIVAELIGATSGITYFINQQGRYRNYENVYAAIMMIGVIGLATDLALAWLGNNLFPWKRQGQKSLWETALDYIRPDYVK
ncbi:MAG: ABC transporter permease subunit [Blastochloris sp.]|nr:ABC transporter permease subunit [Blastochloris sp.]